MPDLGVIKAGEIMEFRVMYSPNNLREHRGVLKIANKYEEHLYKIRGRPIRSSVIEMEHPIKVYEGRRHTDTFSLPEDPNTHEDMLYFVTQLGEKSE